MNEILDTVALVLVLIGGLLCITAAIGLLRFHDVPTRLLAATKPQVLGLILICIAIALALRSWPVVAFLVPATILGLGIGPAVAIHEGSTLLVVFNALRLLAYRGKAA